MVGKRRRKLKRQDSCWEIIIQLEQFLNLFQMQPTTTLSYDTRIMSITFPLLPSTHCLHFSPLYSLITSNNYTSANRLYIFNNYHMSNPSLEKINKEPPPQGKSLTGGFELQTKIRLIIQEVLAATIRKLSHFGDKIDKFEEYFITFKERFETAQRERNKQQEEMQKVQQAQINIRRDLNFNDIRYSEDKERAAIAAKQHRDEYSELQKQVKTLMRQNENINSELSKTKSKFLQYSNIISTLKEEVSWKITKYLEQTAQSHTQMKVYSQNIRNQYFNINLLVDKQKEKYDQIIIKYEQDNAFKQDVYGKITEINKEVSHRKEQVQRISSKVDDVEFAFLSKIKTADAKFQAKMVELQKNNSKLTNIFKKIDTFNHILQTMKEELQEGHKSLQKKSDENLKKANDFTTDEILKLTKQNLKLQKNIDKRLNAFDQKFDKQEDFFAQKMDFLKMQIQSDMSNKTTKMLQQKSKAQQNLASSSIDQINGKINKMQLQNSKNITKVEGVLKQNIGEVKKQVQKLKEDLEDRIDDLGSRPSRPGEGASGGISHQKMHSINNQITHLKESIKEVAAKTDILWGTKEENEKALQDVKKKMQVDFIELDEKLNARVERVMFLVTKMRGDSIIRNEFNDKEIKQLKRTHIDTKERLEASWKLIPSMGECINLILSLIYDAEYQHSRIILDSLPTLAKDVQKFNTCCEGVIYEYKQKKKPGSIFYRHSQLKKTDIVKATFNGYIQVWQQVFEGQLKSKQNFLPKSFYKRLVQKLLKQPNQKPSTEKELSPGNTSFNQLLAPKPNMITENSRNASDPSIDMNASFHIRKKRSAPIKQREKEKEEGANEIFDKINE